MAIKDDYFDTQRILSYNEARMISKKEYNNLKQLAQIEREKIEEKYNIKDDTSFIQKKLVEIIINSTIYPNLSCLNKEIMLANALLPDDIKIIDILSEEGFTLQHLKAIIRFRAILKNLLINKKSITPELKENIEIYKKVTTKLINIFNKHFNIKNSTIILNRICEMLITCPNLFETLEHENKLTKHLN